MMWKPIVATAFALVALPAFAETPDDIVDLLGARAPGAETQMQARGYVDVGGNNTWWNEKTGVCARVHVSQGRYKTIDMLPDGDCGAKAFAESEGAASREPSQAAMDACMNAADAYDEEETGASTVRSFRRSGEDWVVTLNTPGNTVHCTVTQAGNVIAMDPP